MRRDPWNKGRPVGARVALTPQEITLVRRHLAKQTSPHDLCLFTLAIDSMLRASDLLQLRVGDVCSPDGKVRQSFRLRQKKTQQGVEPVLTDTAQAALKKWLKTSEKQSTHFLFTRSKPSQGQPITVGFYRTLIKQWVRAIGLRPHDYSAHSLRRSKAIYLYQSGVRVEIISRLLGHSSPASTLYYLGIDQAEAQSQALSHDIFKATSKLKSSSESDFPTLLAPKLLDRLADDIATRLASRLADPSSEIDSLKFDEAPKLGRE